MVENREQCNRCNASMVSQETVERSENYELRLLWLPQHWQLRKHTAPLIIAFGALIWKRSSNVLGGCRTFFCCLTVPTLTKRAKEWYIWSMVCFQQKPFLLFQVRKWTSFCWQWGPSGWETTIDNADTDSHCKIDLLRYLLEEDSFNCNS